MLSQRQVDANRRNAQLSTGPRTPEGRAAVDLNALRDGLTAQTTVLPNENPEEFQEVGIRLTFQKPCPLIHAVVGMTS